jgi:hypothetical protein
MRVEKFMDLILRSRGAASRRMAAGDAPHRKMRTSCVTLETLPIERVIHT